MHRLESRLLRLKSLADFATGGDGWGCGEDIKGEEILGLWRGISCCRFRPSKQGMMGGQWGSTCRIRVAIFHGGGGYDLLLYPVNVHRLQIPSRLQIGIIFLFLKDRRKRWFFF